MKQLFRLFGLLALLAFPALASSLTLQGVGGAALSGPPAPTVLFQQQSSSTAGGATYTFSAMAIGSAAANRTVMAVVACYANGASRTLNSVTIGGTTAALAATNTPSSTENVAVAVLNVASGTTATVVVNLSGSAPHCSASTYAAYGLASTTPDNTNAASTNPVSASVTTVANGIAVGGLAALSGGTGTFGGTVTNDYNVTDGTVDYAGGSQQTTGSAATMTYSLSVASGFAMASFH